MTTFLDVDGARLETTWAGPARVDGPVLVFLHEGLGSITQWRDTPEAIANATGLRAFVYAREGYGRSSPVSVPRPLTYMHDEAARLPRVLAAAGITDCILIGHSDGASIAIIATGSGVVSPRALVLIAPHVFVEDVSVESIAAAADAYRADLGSSTIRPGQGVRFGENGGVEGRSVSLGLREKLARHHADVDGAFWGWNRAWLDPGFRAWNIEVYLPRITVPTLVVQGDRDEYGTLAQVDAIERGVGGRVERCIVGGAAHAPHRTHGPETVDAITRFLRHAR